MRLRLPAFAVIGILSAAAGAPLGAQSPAVSPLDPLGFAHLKDFEAWRSSSNNPDPNNNDDSKRPLPGETVVLADLAGPGVVTHLWITVAANEYGWPACCGCACNTTAAQSRASTLLSAISSRSAMASSAP